MKFFNDYKEFDETFKKASTGDTIAIIKMLNHLFIL